MNRRTFLQRFGIGVSAIAVMPWKALCPQPRYYRVRYVDVAQPAVVDPASLTDGETTWTITKGDRIYGYGVWETSPDSLLARRVRFTFSPVRAVELPS